MSSGGNLRFMSWNSNGLKYKIEKVKHEIEECHVVFLQETRSSEVLNDLKDWESIYTKQTSNQRGVAILIKKDIFCELHREIDVDSCYVVVKCTIKGQLFTLVSVYNPQADPRPLMKLQNIIEKISKGILLIGGDFNIALNPYLDRNSKTINKKHLHFQPVMNRFMTSFHLVDVWRRFHPAERQHSYEQNEVKSRLDYLLVPEESMHYIKTCEICKKKIPNFDHRPVLFEIRMSDKEFWSLFGFIEQVNKMHICKVINSVYDDWLSYKQWQELDLTINHCTPLIISVREVESAIQSLAVNQKPVMRPDAIQLSFYVNYSYALIPYLCAFYHKILEQSMNIPESFNQAFEVSETHYIFNVDYLILATILARWLSHHLESHSTDYTDDRKNTTVLFTFKKPLKKPLKVCWSTLSHFLEKDKDKTKTYPPLLNTEILNKVLRNSPSGKNKLLCWGCPLTPVLMTLYLKHIAEEMTDEVEDKTSKIFISRENVIARFSVNVDRCLLRDLEKKYKNVDCKLVDEILITSECEQSKCLV